MKKIVEVVVILLFIVNLSCLNSDDFIIIGQTHIDYNISHLDLSEDAREELITYMEEANFNAKRFGETADIDLCYDHNIDIIKGISSQNHARDNDWWYEAEFFDLGYYEGPNYPEDWPLEMKFYTMNNNAGFEIDDVLGDNTETLASNNYIFCDTLDLEEGLVIDYLKRPFNNDKLACPQKSIFHDL